MRSHWGHANEKNWEKIKKNVSPDCDADCHKMSQNGIKKSQNCRKIVVKMSQIVTNLSQNCRTIVDICQGKAKGEMSQIVKNCHKYVANRLTSEMKAKVE
jgi:hypothetical protein